MNYLRSQVALSTLHITYYENIGANFGFASKFVDSLRSGWDNLLAFLIGLVSIWPFIVMLIVMIWFYLRRLKSKAKAKAAELNP
jgi:hypothetical protein